VLTKILEVPVVVLLPSFLTRWRVLYPMQIQTGTEAFFFPFFSFVLCWQLRKNSHNIELEGGTIEAALVAMKHGWCINLGGGFHHASATSGGIFFFSSSLFCFSIN
jgi:histone deacetylase 11